MQERGVGVVARNKRGGLQREKRKFLLRRVTAGARASRPRSREARTTRRLEEGDKRHYTSHRLHDQHRVRRRALGKRSRVKQTAE